MDADVLVQRWEKLTGRKAERRRDVPHIALWNLLQKTADGVEVPEQEHKRILEVAGESTDRFDEMLTTLEACEQAVQGDDATDFLMDVHGKAKAHELIVATRELQNQRSQHNFAKWKLATLIEEVVDRYMRRDDDA